MKQAPILVSWYLENKRELPWRKNSDPYRVWISEVMLQQTTVKAVIPYYLNFLKKFPSVNALAKAPSEKVLENWSGLGYYSRARNLHKAAKILAKDGFPNNYTELLKLPGFGPYTSRAVSSICFAEPVGVLDGNVIRFLTRFHNLKIKWWEPKNRNTLQQLADQWAGKENSSLVNQGLMELGATICTPQSPSCLLCPLHKHCGAFKARSADSLPLKKPRKQKEIWLWKPQIFVFKDTIALKKNSSTPFLKGQLLLPGEAYEKKKSPKSFDYKHNITHHEIYVKISKINKRKLSTQDKKSFKWIKIKDVRKHAPVTLIQKALKISDLV